MKTIRIAIILLLLSPTYGERIEFVRVPASWIKTGNTWSVVCDKGFQLQVYIPRKVAENSELISADHRRNASPYVWINTESVSFLDELFHMNWDGAITNMYSC